MGKATELDDYLASHPLPPEEVERRDGPRPKLRLGHSVIAQAVGPNAHVQDVLASTSGETRGVTALRDAESGVTVIAVPAERYLELVTSYIRDRNLSEMTLDNRAIPSDATLAELGVEQVDPGATWLDVGKVVG